MVSSGWFLLVVFIFTNSAFSEAVSLNDRERRAVEPRYHFNHPPSAEYYNPIPVAVVYEGGYSDSGKIELKSFSNIKEQEKNVKAALTSNDTKTSTEKELSTTATPNIDIKNETEKGLITTTAPKITKTKKELLAKPRALIDFQIPVAVVYDSNPYNYESSQTTKLNTNRDPAKLRSGFNQKQQTVADDSRSIKQTTARPARVTIELKPKEDRRVFKKRTEEPDPVIPIIEMENYVFSHNGNFHYSYEGGDGTKAYSEGKQITVDDETGESVAGGFSYKDKDGNNFSLTYTADENGYRPVGAHLPTPPPIPPAIAKALEYLATATPETVTKRPNKSR